jgi:hypothetical protein
MFTELGRVIEMCREELDAKVVDGGGDPRQVAVLAHTMMQWFGRIESQARRCEWDVFTALGKKD